MDTSLNSVKKDLFNGHTPRSSSSHCGIFVRSMFPAAGQSSEWLRWSCPWGYGVYDLEKKKPQTGKMRAAEMSIGPNKTQHVKAFLSPDRTLRMYTHTQRDTWLFHFNVFHTSAMTSGLFVGLFLSQFQKPLLSSFFKNLQKIASLVIAKQASQRTLQSTLFVTVLFVILGELSLSLSIACKHVFLFVFEVGCNRQEGRRGGCQQTAVSVHLWSGPRCFSQLLLAPRARSQLFCSGLRASDKRQNQDVHERRHMNKYTRAGPVFPVKTNLT